MPAASERLAVVLGNNMLTGASLQLSTEVQRSNEETRPRGLAVMTFTDELLANDAERYAAAFAQGDLPIHPAPRMAVVACMDARLNLYGLLGLQEGDAHVIRNAGGVITDDEIRLLAISPTFAGHQGDHAHPPHGLRDGDLH